MLTLNRVAINEKLAPLYEIAIMVRDGGFDSSNLQGLRIEIFWGEYIWQRTYHGEGILPEALIKRGLVTMEGRRILSLLADSALASF